MKLSILILPLILLLSTSCTEEKANATVLEGSWYYDSSPSPDFASYKEYVFRGDSFFLSGYPSFERSGTFIVSENDTVRLTVVFDYDDEDLTVRRVTSELTMDPNGKYFYVGLEGPYARQD